MAVQAKIGMREAQPWDSRNCHGSRLTAAWHRRTILNVAPSQTATAS